MRRTENQIRELLGPLDPMRHDDHPTVPPAPTVIADIDSPPTAHTRWSRRAHARRPLLAAAAAAVVVLVGAMLWTSAGPSAPKAYATPPPLTIVPPSDTRPASVVLNEIADRAAGSGVPAGQAGQTEYTKMKNWYLHSQVGGGDTVSAVQPEIQELWRYPDDSARQVTRTGAPEFQSDEDRENWASDAVGDERVDDWPRGRSFSWHDRPPTDVDALHQWLRQRPSGQPDPLRTFTDVTDLLRERVLLPSERAAVLRLVAVLPGLDFAGQTHDRAGRPGLAFALEPPTEGLPTRYTLIIDPSNGLVLGHEEMLTESAGKLQVRIPAVLTYQTYLQQELQNNS